MNAHPRDSLLHECEDWPRHYPAVLTVTAEQGTLRRCWPWGLPFITPSPVLHNTVTQHCIHLLVPVAGSLCQGPLASPGTPHWLGVAYGPQVCTWPVCVYTRPWHLAYPRGGCQGHWTRVQPSGPLSTSFPPEDSSPSTVTFDCSSRGEVATQDFWGAQPRL